MNLPANADRPTSILLQYGLKRFRCIRARCRHLVADMLSGDMPTHRPCPKFTGIIVHMAIGLAFSSAHADGVRMAELCSRSHRDIVSMYVEGALDNAESNATAIMSELEKSLEGGSSEISGLKRSWKLVMPYCPPGRFKADQATDIFCDFLTLNPQKRRNESMALLNEALQHAWPCPAGQKK
jgi:hypothetical protein